MSGPDDRRGPDGGEHPLDVDARFADIIAHFHDDEPSPPRVVDGYDDAAETTGTAPAATAEDASDPSGATGHDVTGRPAPDEGGPTTGGPTTDSPTTADPTTGPVADLAAMRRSYEARISAEIDRAVDGPGGGHFVPADPPPLPRPDLPGRLAWTAVLAGPGLLLLCALLWRSAPSWLLGAVVTGIVVGFGYLVWRLPPTRDRDDPGDGAIV